MKTLRKNNKIEDRLGDLPDSVLLRILSFFDSKEAVQSCIFSKRWKNLWKNLPTLVVLSYQPFGWIDFTNFISNFLSLRDDSTALHAFYFNSFGIMKPELLERILKYAFSHNIQQLHMVVTCYITQFPPSFFACPTLTSLKLHFRYYKRVVFPNSLNLPALINLSICNFVFCVNDDGRIDPFSTINKLNSLKISNCMVRDRQSVCISSATLANLSIQTGTVYTYSDDDMNFQLCTPSLCTFLYWGIPLQKLCGSMDNLSSVKHVEIYVPFDDKLRYYKNTPTVLYNWLVELANIESLTVSQDTLKVLSLVRCLLKAEFRSLYNLKSLNVKDSDSYTSKKIVDFLLQNAPLAEASYDDQGKCAFNLFE